MTRGDTEGDIALLYCRQSLRKKGSDDVSLDTQEMLLREMARDKGYLVPDDGVIRDESQKGWKENRPGLLMVQERAEQQRCTVLLVWAIDRFARSVRITENVVYELAKHGVRLESHTEPWIADPAQRQQAAIEAERYTRILSQRMKGVWKLRSLRGQYHGRAPIGYIRLDGKLAPDPNPATIALVNEAMHRYLAGEGSSTLAQDFRLRTGQGWTARRVLDLLSNPAYIGTVTVGETTQVGAHPPIVDPGLFQRVQDALSARRAPRSGVQLSWLSGLVWCGCGAPMYPVVMNARDKYPHALFRCRYGSGGTNGEHRPCPAKKKSITIRHLEATVIDQLVADLTAAAGADPATVAKELAAEQRRRHPDWPKRKRELTAAISKLQRQRMSIIEMRQDLLISREASVARIKPIDAQIDGLEHEIAAGPEPVNLGAITAAHAVASELAEDVADFGAELGSEWRTVLQELGGRVIVTDGVPDIVYAGEMGALVG